MSPNPRVAHSTAQAPAPTGRYSQAIEAGGLVFLAGQAPHDPDGNVPEAFEDQVRQCFTNLAAVAAAAGTSLDRAVRVGVFISPRADASAYNRIYAELMTADPPPARTTSYSDFIGFDVEIEATLLPGDGTSSTDFN